jgi:phenylacetyl-CoA:acceptor oxidoreductase subunit 1
MVIDINRCVGCQTCTIACKHTNDTPPGVQWRRVLDVEEGEYPDVERLFLVVGCQHCADPPCVPVCPTGATKQRADGLVTMNYDTCIGCGYCAVACPYQARTIVDDAEWYYGAPTEHERLVHHAERLGVATKCTFCVERIDEAKERGLTPGVDLEVTPSCATSCIAQAIRFGDFADPDSTVSQLVQNNKSFQMHAELGTDPQIKYLYEVPNATPGRAADTSEDGHDPLTNQESPLVGERQTLWDARAAMNFTLGGMSTGLVVMAYLAHLGDGLTVAALMSIYVAAGVGMAVGLFFVFLEISRKLRFLYVLLRPQSSWMTRETYFVALFYPVLLADLFFPHPALHGLVAVSALGFLISQSMILYAGKGIPAWRAPLIPWMLAATGLFEGSGLLVLAGAIFPGEVQVGRLPVIAGLALALVNAALWHRYRTTAAAHGIGPLAKRSLEAITPGLHLIGHALPAALFGAILLALIGGQLPLAIAGAAAVAGGVLWKFTVITRACYQQGFAVPMMPQRGSGSRAAPARLTAQ